MLEKTLPVTPLPEIVVVIIDFDDHYHKMKNAHVYVYCATTIHHLCCDASFREIELAQSRDPGES